MGLLYKDELLDAFGAWAFAYIPYGGPDFGEIAAVAKAVGDGGADAFHECWVAAGDRAAAQAEAARNAGRTTSARELFLRGSAFYAVSLHPLFGAPVDPRLTAAFRKEIAAFDNGLALFDPPIKPQAIPFEGGAMPAYFIPAAGFAGARRPTVIFTNGYDSTIADMYFASAVAAGRRGYHSLLFDGPGQGAMLFERNIPLRPDWETVVKAAVDFALTLPEVDADKIALSGWSLGGYLSPRAASGEHRLAACVADCAQWALLDSFRAAAVKMGLPPAAAADLGAIDETAARLFDAVIKANRELNWKVVKRGFWANGVTSLRDYLREAERFTMKGRAGDIRCPTLLMAAENDPLAIGAETLFDALKCPKKLIRFTAAEGAGDHCEMMNRSLVNRTVLDWLDETLKTRS
ncbi:MAG TPA: CocE/NonD family hydrolase [Roseiarcus sp.]|nr:CocE/NonD family hydrolase [Roseiarcus sp.]